MNLVRHCIKCSAEGRRAEKREEWKLRLRQKGDSLSPPGTGKNVSVPAEFSPGTFGITIFMSLQLASVPLAPQHKTLELKCMHAKCVSLSNYSMEYVDTRLFEHSKKHHRNLREPVPFRPTLPLAGGGPALQLWTGLQMVIAAHFETGSFLNETDDDCCSLWELEWSDSDACDSELVSSTF
ncbi:hypothetical protein JZ751_028721 [Albula glossodonta]|uniref:Uncharacterized protein n=1 Tax=Albula glossodonta TaxID=121402 RepID=A0A8T2NDP4_9TELE|nr:hypothetical protein JZ751_028721 [Albula glossodonta]